MKAKVVLGLMALTLAACQTNAGSSRQTTSVQMGRDGWSNGQGASASRLIGQVKPLNIMELPETIRQEHEDRTNRLARLSRQFGAQAPEVQDDLQVGENAVPGVGHDVPVIRVRYAERTFFDTDSAKIRPEAAKILDVLAESMRRDMPDTSLLVLGHTDSRGSEAYNSNLSLRRAASVMVELANRGVRIEQMSTAGIGEVQPIASNSTEEGMARNRRVEFMISRFEQANLATVQDMRINRAWLNDHPKAAIDPDGRMARAEDAQSARLRDGHSIEIQVHKPSEALLDAGKSEAAIAEREAMSAEVLEPAPLKVTIVPAPKAQILPDLGAAASSTRLL
jgi:outer membrane protein OmpA-like peptidoglycan-associated protein